MPQNLYIVYHIGQRKYQPTLRKILQFIFFSDILIEPVLGGTATNQGLSPFLPPSHRSWGINGLVNLMFSYLNGLTVYWNTFQWSVYDMMSIHQNFFYDFYVPKGIYIIWYIDAFGYPTTVYVGQGNIKQRLRQHRLDLAIRIHNFKGLYVSWVPIAFQYQRNGIERYLGETLKPLVGSNYPIAIRRNVNLPWDDWQ